MEVGDSLAVAVCVEFCDDYLLLGFLAFYEASVDGLDLLNDRLLAEDHFCN